LSLSDVPAHPPAVFPAVLHGLSAPVSGAVHAVHVPRDPQVPSALNAEHVTVAVPPFLYPVEHVYDATLACLSKPFDEMLLPPFDLLPDHATFLFETEPFDTVGPVPDVPSPFDTVGPVPEHAVTVQLVPLILKPSWHVSQ